MHECAKYVLRVVNDLKVNFHSIKKALNEIGRLIRSNINMVGAHFIRGYKALYW